ncbi:MAG TPA: type 2 lanthipeptide synthetase LanM [Ktedonosporobacter sp.]|nr:type 2 lanthipeptide synthetase LanM [Ktedonosporobacter sp.]
MSDENMTEVNQALNVDERLRILREEDLQRWLERVSAMCQSMKISSTTENLLALRPSQTPVTCERLLEEACAIGDQLCRRAIKSDGMAVWISPALVKKTGEWAPRPIGIDWYDGIAGIAFFLGYLGQVTREQKYTTLTRLALQSVRFKIGQYTERQKGIGAIAFVALRSAIHLFTHLGALWNDAALFREAEMLVEQLPALISQDQLLDIISGTAGAIVSLLGLHTLVPSARIIEVAQLGGEHLLAQSREMQQGWGWYTMPGSPPLTGFSHGAAGIAYSLLWLASVSKDVRFHAMALAGLAYERGLFSPEQKNWPDLRQIGQSKRQTTSPPRFHHLWCHGAPGIGLARLASLPYLSDGLIYEEIEAALKTTRAQGFGHNHSLCHGDFGNLETLLIASQAVYPDYKKPVEQITAMLLDSIKATSWVCGAPLGIETPGLMRGLAGIGYQLLRLAEPERVPSVLLFAPPA